MCSFKVFYTCAWYPRSQILEFTVQILFPPQDLPGGGGQKFVAPLRFIFVYALDYMHCPIWCGVQKRSGLLPEYSMECHCSCHICEESEKEEESCQVGHRGDGTKDVSVSTGKN